MKKFVQNGLEKFYNFTTRSQLNRRLVGSAISLILFGAIFLVGNGVVNAIQENIARAERQQAIERVTKAPASEYLDFYQATVSDTPIGEAPRLNLCRKLKHGSINIDAVRTFIQFSDGQQKQVSIREFDARIEQSITNTDCTSVNLQGQPQIVGEYQIYTEYCFKTPDYDIKKCDNYRSNKYKMTDNLTQLQAEIQRLQAEYDRRINGGAIDPTPINTLTLPTQSENTTTTPATPNQSVQGSTGTGSSGNTTTTPPANAGGIVIDLPLLPPIIIGG